MEAAQLCPPPLVCCPIRSVVDFIMTHRANPKGVMLPFVAVMRGRKQQQMDRGEPCPASCQLFQKEEKGLADANVHILGTVEPAGVNIL